MRKLRLFLVNAGFVDHARNPGTTPPIGLLCLAAYLRSRFDLDIRIINQRAERWSDAEVARRVIEFKPDVVGLSAMTPLADSLIAIARAVRVGVQDSLIVLGGPHIAAVEEKALEETGADASVIGEGELSFAEIIGAHFGGGDFGRIPGLIWRARDGQIVKNPGTAPMIEDLDSLPFPAYDLIDLRQYWGLWSISVLPRGRYITLFGSRGCPFHCYWCHSLFGGRFRAHSVERMVDEIDFYIRQYHVNDVEFIDDVFNLDRERVVAFSDLLRKRNIRVALSFSNGLRADLLTEEVVEALKSVGTYYVSLGLETASPRLQTVSGKRLNIERYLRGVEMTTRRRIFTNGFHILGLPTETEEELLQTVRLACESPLHTACFSTPMPFPNTPLYKQVAERHPEKLVNLKYRDFDYYGPFVNVSEFSNEVLFRYQRDAHRRFYSSPRRLARIARDMPRPHLLPLYLPMLIRRANRKILGGSE